MHEGGEAGRITFSVFVEEDANECNNKNGKNCSYSKNSATDA
jgi:hypothetical protein